MKATFNDVYSGNPIWSGRIEVAEKWHDESNEEKEKCQADLKVLANYMRQTTHATWDQLCSSLVRFLTFDGKKITPGELSSMLNGEWFSMDALIKWLASRFWGFE